MATNKIRSSTQLYIDANLNVNSKKLEAVSTGTADTDGVNVGQMNTAIGTAVSGVGGAIHVPVADLSACKAVVAAGRSDKMIMLVETLGLYRYDAESAAASNDNTVIRPIDIATDASAGRWLKISSTLTDHNNLSSLQGGTTNEYYHLTQAELAKLGGIEANADVTDAQNIAAVLNAATTKDAIHDNDKFGFVDSENSNVLKKTTWSNIKSKLKTYFDTLYAPKTSRVYRATPSGTVNGSNQAFTIPALVLTGTEEVFKNGLLQNAGSGNDYTITYGATSTITFETAPSNTPFVDVILVNYSY